MLAPRLKCLRSGRQRIPLPPYDTGPIGRPVAPAPQLPRADLGVYQLVQWLNRTTLTSCPIFSYLNRVLKDTFLYTRNGLAFVMATEKAETDRIPVTLALSTITYLEKLVRQGTHGTSVPGVARTLIEEGIRLAIKDGLLSIRDNGKS